MPRVRHRQGGPSLCDDRRSSQDDPWYHGDLRSRHAQYSDLPPVVYLVRRGPYVKIGYSEKLALRFYHLGVKSQDVLAVVPGSYPEERALHDLFAPLRASGPLLGREHYHPGADLRAYVDMLRDRAGVPPVNW